MLIGLSEMPGCSYGMSNIELARRDSVVTYACWFHGLGDLTVLVTFALPGEPRQGMVDAWHPRMGNRLKIGDFRELQPPEPVADLASG